MLVDRQNFIKCINSMHSLLRLCFEKGFLPCKRECKKLEILQKF